jgi:alpha-tubulin suppressor-like RCC1 family protein
MGDALLAVDLGMGKIAIAIAAGLAHTCALLEGGSVKCWGGNGSGQLGLGDKDNRGHASGQMGDELPAVDLGEGAIALSIAAGYKHTCVRLMDGAVACWGGSFEGQLGLGDQEARGDGPGEMGNVLPRVDFGANVGVSFFSLGHYHSCARLTNGAVKCWGNNDDGELGLGDLGDRGDQPDEMGNALPAVLPW